MIKFLKKLTGSVRFYKPETKKNKLNRTQTEKNSSQTGKKSSQTEKLRKIGKNRVKPVFVLKNQTELKPVSLNRFQFLFIFKKFNLINFFYKNQTKSKIIIHIYLSSYGVFWTKTKQWLEGEISPSNSMTLVFHLYYFEII